MLTKADKDWITQGLKSVRDSVDLLRGKVSTLNFEKFNFDSRLDSIEASHIRTEEKIDKVLAILDGFSGKVQTREEENKMGAATLRRHDTQIHKLATATGTKLSE